MVVCHNNVAARVDGHKSWCRERSILRRPVRVPGQTVARKCCDDARRSDLSNDIVNPIGYIHIVHCVYSDAIDTQSAEFGVRADAVCKAGRPSGKRRHNTRRVSNDAGVVGIRDFADAGGVVVGKHDVARREDTDAHEGIRTVEER